jgi:glucose/arabinose dehydrogenase
MAHAGDGSGRIFVVEKEGQIRILLDGEVFPEPFLDIRQKVGIQRWEQGFLGLAFHPNYVENGLFFVNYTNVNFNTVIASYTVSEDDPNVANQNSEKIVLEVNQPDSEHNGGQIEFGRDGYFYIAFGDGGSPGYNSQTRVSGQSLDNYLGKILRLDMENGPPYSFPRDNPLDGEKEQIEILAYGLRNPWRFSVDWVSGDMFIADVGQSSWEEINLLRRDSQLPVNFGWNYYQSSDPYFEPGPPDLIWERPIVAYAHEDGRCAIIGGLIYRGEALPDWDGIYFYSDFCSGEIFGLIPTKDGGWESQLLYESSINVTSFGMDEAGELYILDREGGVYRLVESSETN